MKYLLFVGSILIIAIAAYSAGLHKQCTEIDLHNDHSFWCDGRKIQGPGYPKAYTTDSWEFHSN